jgi:hypothetical protein
MVHATIKILAAYMLISSVSALNEANITITNPMSICLREGGEYTCNGTAAIILSGTSDHMLDFVPAPIMDPNGDDIKKTADLIHNVPGIFIENIPYLFMFGVLGALFAWGMLAIVKGGRP